MARRGARGEGALAGDHVAGTAPRLSGGVAPLISGGWDLPSLIVTARGESLGVLLLGIPMAIAGIVLGWFLIKGHRRAYHNGVQKDPLVPPFTRRWCLSLSEQSACVPVPGPAVVT